jgi:hypothetical protein
LTSSAAVLCAGSSAAVPAADLAEKSTLTGDSLGPALLRRAPLALLLSGGIERAGVWCRRQSQRRSQRSQSPSRRRRSRRRSLLLLL